MFGFFTKIKKKLSHFFKRFVELCYAFLNKLGFNLQPKHFSTSDTSNHQDWIVKNKDRILSLLRQSSMPVYLSHPSLISKELRQKTLYQQPDLYYLFDCNDSMLKQQGLNIIVSIIEYASAENSSKNFISKVLGASGSKLTPERMLLTIMSDYIKNIFINYSGNAKDLAHMRQVMDFMSILLTDKSIRQNRAFFNLLKRIRKELVVAYRIIGKQVKLNELRETSNYIAVSLKNTTMDVMSVLYNVFNFCHLKCGILVYDINKGLLRAPSNKVNRLFKALVVLFRSVFTLETHVVAKYETSYNNSHGIKLLAHDNRSSVLTHVLPVLQKKLDSKNGSANWQHLLLIQEDLIYLVAISNIVTFVNGELSKFYNAGFSVSISDLCYLLNSLKSKFPEVINNYKFLMSQQKLFDNYKCTSATNSEVSLIEQINKLLESTNSSLIDLEKNINKASDIIDELKQFDKEMKPVNLDIKTIVDLIDSHNFISTKKPFLFTSNSTDNVFDLEMVSNNNELKII